MLGGCQSTALELTALDTQRQFFSDGAVAVASPMDHTLALLAASGEDQPNGERIKLLLQIENTGPDAFDIDTANVRVHSDKRSSLKVFTYDDLVKEEKQRAVAAAIIVGIAGGINSYNAAQASTVRTSGTYQSHTSTSYGSVSTTGNYSGTVHDPLRGQIAMSVANAQTSATLTSISQRTDANLSYLKGTVLKRTTLFPGTRHGGEITFEAPALNQKEERTYFITVTAGADTHQFRLTQKWK